MTTSPLHGRAIRSIRIVGLLCVAVGVAILAWLGSIMYGRTATDEALLLALGIPLLLLIAWAGVTLSLRGLAWILERR